MNKRTPPRAVCPTVRNQAHCPLLFRVVANGHEYLIYTDGTTKGFSGNVNVYNYHPNLVRQAVQSSVANTSNPLNVVLKEQHINLLGHLADLVSRAHDAHIWEQGDNHPVGFCEYCQAVHEARVLLGQKSEFQTQADK